MTTAAPSSTVEAALALVADQVREVRKTGRNESQGFSFRGIDAVVNAVGPAFRAHGITCTPLLERVTLDPMLLTGGKVATRALVEVRYRFHGPDGSTLDALVPGEAFDMGDKATAKAMSVAYRTCLLQALTIPTDEPDPDGASFDQAPTTTGPPPWVQLLAKTLLFDLVDADPVRAGEAWATLEAAAPATAAGLALILDEWRPDPDEVEVEVEG